MAISPLHLLTCLAFFVLSGSDPLTAAPGSIESVQDFGTQASFYEDSHTFAQLGKIGGDSVILIPGGEVAAKRYVELAKEIVTQDPHVSVFVARFTRDYVTPWEMGPKVKAILAVMERLGWQQPASSSYLAAHSMGGILGHPEVEKSKLRGLILLASYLPEALIGGSRDSVVTYPQPILILGAEWDRRVDLHVQARAFSDFRGWQKDHPTENSKFVGVLSGASHMQFADGVLLASDVAPTRPAGEVRKEIATLVTAFLRLQDPVRRNPQDRQTLDDLVEASERVFSPVHKTASLDKSACSWLQDQLGQGDARASRQEAEVYASYGAFALARPSMDAKATLHVPTHLEQLPNPFDLPGTPFGIPVALSCKITVPRQPASVRSAGQGRCEEADRLLAKAVADALTDDQRNRWESTHAQIAFSNLQGSSWAQWLVTPTAFRHKGDVTSWESHSVSWEERDGQVDVLTCKLTPPTRWLFYYLRDAHLTSLEGAVRL